MMKFTLICSLFLLSSYAFAQELAINLDGKKIKNISLEEIRKLKDSNVEFFNSVTRRSELYKGVLTLGFIEKIYPDSQNILEIELISENNVTFFIPMSRLLQTNSILAYERADGDKFVRFSQKEKILVPLAPLYLVWDLKGISKEDRLLYTSVYQIKAINLISNNVDFGVKEDTVNASVYLGYQTYKNQCMNCHALGKKGGTYSFDLLKRKTLSNKGSDYVKQYVIDPKSMNLQSKMLPFPKFKNNQEMVQGLIDFLKFMENPEELLKKHKAAADNVSYKALKEIVREAN